MANCRVAALAKTDVLASRCSSHLAIFDLVKRQSVTDDTRWGLGRLRRSGLAGRAGGAA